MWKKFSLQGNYKWLDILSDLLKRYNGNVHRTIGMRTRDVSAANEARILKTKFPLQKSRGIPPKFKLGDRVRISKSKRKRIHSKLVHGDFHSSSRGQDRSSHLSTQRLPRRTDFRWVLRARTYQSPLSGCVPRWKSSQETQKSNFRKVVGIR